MADQATPHITQDIFYEAVQFVTSQTPPYVVINTLPVGYGFINTRIPALIVATPLEETADHGESLCAIFHEYGHLVDMLHWIEKNSELKHKSPFESAVAYNTHLERVGILETPGNRLNRDAVLAHESAAWEFGKNGFPNAKPHPFKGLIDFIAQCSSITDKTAIVALYDKTSKKMFETYVNDPKLK